MVDHVKILKPGSLHHVAVIERARHPGDPTGRFGIDGRREVQSCDLVFPATRSEGPQQRAPEEACRTGNKDAHSASNKSSAIPNASK